MSLQEQCHETTGGCHETHEVAPGGISRISFHGSGQSLEFRFMDFQPVAPQNPKLPAVSVLSPAYPPQVFS